MFTKLPVIESAVGFPVPIFFQDKEEKCRKYKQKNFIYAVKKAGISLTDFHGTRNLSMELRIDLLY